MVPEPHADFDLVQRALRRERAALGELAARLRTVPRVLAARNARFGGVLSFEDLADVSQDVLLIVWRKLDQYQGFSAFDGWLYRITAFEFMNALRRKGGRLTLVDDQSLDPGDEPDPFEFEDVHRSLERIETSVADVVRLKHFEDLTFEAIGVRLGVSPNTAKARYYRGLKSLEILLEARRSTQQ
ncbi:RNA polymerase sigma factor [Engelhardtia mirabilis]|uniref:ECF RNA polymerase sigma factor SigE n=1 Tax=Engelhardtia mirabilis TaxID=2528011 RepID=A0A518BET1_9BACT|nr:ECF RNA polymerase sigma factor SigE [Planctomycetes bacterium Pla133]QDU99825.1 ECF RNA polymerase sigma factor SigE [Planctomycetes bacterium Pla86]